MMTINEQENLTLSDRKCCTESVKIFAFDKNKMGSSWLPKNKQQKILVVNNSSPSYWLVFTGITHAVLVLNIENRLVNNLPVTLQELIYHDF
ncbi:hypothetical protein FMH15_15130 [Vibrio alginolyticus]|nr:hypothetical protein [Vibrio alginolyticus]